MTREAFDLAVDQLLTAKTALEHWERDGYGAFVAAAKVSIVNARKLLLCHHPDTEVVERELGGSVRKTGTR